MNYVSFETYKIILVASHIGFFLCLYGLQCQDKNTLSRKFQLLRELFQVNGFLVFCFDFLLDFSSNLKIEGNLVTLVTCIKFPG